MSEDKKDVIVVARRGYSALVNFGVQTLDIDCYNPVNLSDMFSEDVIKECTSLNSHLAAGNLIYYEEGQELPEDPNAKYIKKLRQDAAKHLEAQYEQKEQGDTANMSLETITNVDKHMQDHIQEQVAKNREAIIQKDQAILKKGVITENVDSVPKERKTAMTEDELLMKVSMDVDPKDFVAKQQAQKIAMDRKESNEALRAEQETIKNVEQDN